MTNITKANCRRQVKKWKEDAGAVNNRDMFETINDQYFQLTNSEKKVADYVLSHRSQVQYMSISDLAQACVVADATISRFCRRLGLRGYNEFKIELAAASTARRAREEIPGLMEGENTYAQMCDRIYSESISALEQTARLLDPIQVHLAIDLLEEAQRVFCMGQGGSMIMAEEAWSMLSSISPKFSFIPDSHLQINTTALMGPGDVILFFSYSGSTRDLQDILEVARQRKVQLILVSRFQNSPGGKQADVVLQCGANERPLQTASAQARMSQLFVVDILLRHLAERTPEQAERCRRNISGALGKKHL